MEHTPEQLSGFKAEFARRQRRQLAVTAVLFLGAFSVMALRARSPFESPSGIALLLAALAALVVFSLQNWRCPACGGYLGKAVGPRFCPRCGVALR